jgi:hypothetical protein
VWVGGDGEEDEAEVVAAVGVARSRRRMGRPAQRSHGKRTISHDTG